MKNMTIYKTVQSENLVCKSNSFQETFALGQKIGGLLKQGDLIALEGDLGSGKTCFTKGIAIGLGVPRDTIITSPTFSLINEYDGRCPFYHMDVYRLGSLSEFLATGLEDYFYQEGVVCLEWADYWPEILPPWSLKVRLSIIDESSRKLVFSGEHPRSKELLRKIE